MIPMMTLDILPGPAGFLVVSGECIGVSRAAAYRGTQEARGEGGKKSGKSSKIQKFQNFPK